MAKRVAEFLKVSFEQFAEGYRDSFGECDEKLIREVYDSLKLPRERQGDRQDMISLPR